MNSFTPVNASQREWLVHLQHRHQKKKKKDQIFDPLTLVFNPLGGLATNLLFLLFFKKIEI